MKNTRPGETLPVGFERVTPAPGWTMLVAGGLDPEALAAQIVTPTGDAHPRGMSAVPPCTPWRSRTAAADSSVPTGTAVGSAT